MKTRPKLSLQDVRAMTSAALTRSQAAELLDVDPRSITRGVAAGTLPCVRLGRRVLVPREALLRLLDGGSSPPPLPDSVGLT